MRKFCCCCLAFLMPAAAMPAETVTIPFGTTVFCEMDQQITTRQKETYAVQTGDSEPRTWASSCRGRRNQWRRRGFNASRHWWRPWLP